MLQSYIIESYVMLSLL